MTKKELRACQFALRPGASILMAPFLVRFLLHLFLAEHAGLNNMIMILLLIVCILRLAFARTVVGDDAIYFINFLNCVVKKIPFKELTHMALERDPWDNFLIRRIGPSEDEYVVLYSVDQKRFSLSETDSQYDLFIDLLENRGVKLIDNTRKRARR